MIRNVPAEGVLLDDVAESGLVGEEEGQVGREDAVLHVPQHLGSSLIQDFLVNTRTCTKQKYAHY